MRRALLLLVLTAACGQDTTPGTPTGPHSPCPPTPTNLPPACEETCGNGQIDACTRLGEQGECYTYNPSRDLCDGAASTVSCTDFGYYGGSPACTSSCTFDDSNCDACAVSCTSSADQASMAAVAGAYVGIIGKPQIGSWRIAILDATLSEAASTAIEPPWAIAGVSDGWLLVNGTHVQHVDFAGNVTTGGALAVDRVTGFVYGPGGHALVVWPDPASPLPQVLAAVLDGSGAVVVQPFVLFDASTMPGVATATTDGTSFFVATGGRLVRVAADGTPSAVITGFPQSASASVPVQLSWSGSTGWYLVPTDGVGISYAAQHFDATGAAQGAPFTLMLDGGAFGVQAYGTGLVGFALEQLPDDGLYHVLNRLSLRHFDATGARVATTDVGVTGTSSPIVLPFGGGLAVAWNGAQHDHVELVTP